jgi:hypothetical protein
MSLIHKIEPASAKQWLHTAGDEPLVLTSLADNAARQGDSLDLGASFAEEFGFMLVAKPNAAPTLGALIRIALGFSADGTLWPGGLTGADGSLADPVKRIGQLQELRPLVLIDGTAAQAVQGKFRPSGRYVAPVVWLDGIGQPLTSTGGDHKFIIWPLPAITD